jgi:hypothetical protein
MVRAILIYQRIVCEQHRLIEQHLARFNVPMGAELPDGLITAGFVSSCYTQCTLRMIPLAFLFLFSVVTQIKGLRRLYVPTEPDTCRATGTWCIATTAG